MSEQQIADSFGDSVENVKKIINGQKLITPDHFNHHIEHQKLKFFEFVHEAILPEHLPPKIREKVEICLEIAENLKKRK